MPARSTAVILRNQTLFPLTLADSGLDHGEWSDGFSPPAIIAAGATYGWQSESAGIATGTEGHVNYNIVGLGKTLYIYWDNPFVGLNQYQQSVGSGFGLSFSGGKGNNTQAVYTLQPDTPVLLAAFLPSRNGFPFGNSWPSEPLTYLTLPPEIPWFGGKPIAIGDASNGLCGGMVFAIRDYFDAAQFPAQMQPKGPGDPVFDYIVRRLFDSFNSPVFGSCDPVPCGGYNLLANVVDFQTQMDPVYPDSDNYVTDGTIGDGRAWIMAHEAWPAIQASIDSGEPCPIGLVLVKSLLPTDLGQNHQVMVYGYQLQQQQLTLHIYDPNSPSKDDVQISLNISDTSNPISVAHNVNVPGQIYSFFVLRYERMPPVGGTHSLRLALLRHGLNPAQGVRQVRPPVTSLRAFMTM